MIEALIFILLVVLPPRSTARPVFTAPSTGRDCNHGLCDEDGIKVLCTPPFGDDLVIPVQGCKGAVKAKVNLQRIVGSLVGHAQPEFVGCAESLLEQRLFECLRSTIASRHPFRFLKHLPAASIAHKG